MTPEARLWLVAGLVLAVTLVVLVGRWLQRRRHVVLPDTGLAPGVYFLSSADCDPCAEARRVLDRRGVDFSELTWQDHARVFQRLAIDEVPSVLVVDDTGAGKWWSGTGPAPMPGRRPGSG